MASKSLSSELPSNLIPELARENAPSWGETKWCPNSVCKSTTICNLCRRRWLIILATGRSASTTLLYMLNSLPGIRLSGENNDELKVLKEAIDNIRRDKQFLRGENKKNPWGHNPVPQGAYGCVVQKMMETINPPGQNNDYDDETETIIGFKTIRFFNNVDIDDVEDLVQFLKESFPCARFVLNVRSDTVEQATSTNAAFPKSNVRVQNLDRMNGLIKTFAKLLGDSAYLLDSTEWVQNIEVLNDMVLWLGFAKACAFHELLEFNTHIYSHGRTRTIVDPQCHYTG